MKTVKDFRVRDNLNPDGMHKGTKLPPMKKSGKEKYNLYGDLEDPEEEEYGSKRESVFDYFDDEEEDI